MRTDPAFADAGENWTQFRDELEARMARFEARNGTLGDLETQYQNQLLKARTCPECNFCAKTQWHMDYRHRGSKVCMRRVAEQLGKELMLPSRQRVDCVCGLTVFRCNLDKHQQGDLHKNKLEKKNGFHCQLCDKSFKGKRPKKAYDAHCKLSKKHLLLESLREECDIVS